MANVRGTVAMSITIPNNVKEISDLILTPPGFLDVPKGSYSQLLSALLSGYIENTFETDIITIYDIFQDNPDISFEGLKEAVQTKKEGLLAI